MAERWQDEPWAKDIWIRREGHRAFIRFPAACKFA